MLLAQMAYARRRRARELSPGERGTAVWAGALLFHAVALVATAALGLGVSYLFLWWTVGGALGLLLLARSGGERWWPSLAVGVLPGALVTMQAAYLLVALFVPIAGRFLVPFPFDLIIAAMIGLCAVVLLALPMAMLQRAERLAGITAIAVLLAVGGLVATWTAFSSTSTTPRSRGCSARTASSSTPGGATYAPS